MKFIAFWTLIFITGFASVAQTKSDKVDIVWGDEQVAKRTTLDDIVGYDQLGFYALKSKGKGISGYRKNYFIEHYDTEMRLLKSVPILLEINGRKNTLEYIVQFGDELLLFTSYNDHKISKKYLYVQKINKSTLRPERDALEIAEVNYSGKKRYYNGYCDYKLSSDSSKLMVYYEIPYDREAKERIGVQVFDKGFNLSWSKEIELPYEARLFSVEDYGVDSEGNVHVLGIIYDEKPVSKRKGKPNYKYQIISYYNKGVENIEYPVEIQGKFLTDMQMAFDKNNIICGGFYSEMGSFSIKGSYFIRINKETKEVVSEDSNEFGMDFITQNMTPKEEKKTKKKVDKGKNVELYEYDLDRILVRKDGGATLIGEQYYVRVVTRTSYGANGTMTTTTTYYYYYNDIIVIRMAPDGSIEWTEKIPKRQVTTNDGGFYSSYAMAVRGDKLYFVFNDNPKNLFYNGTAKLSYFRGGYKESLVVLVEVDEDGRQSKEALFSSKEAEIITRPKVCEQISANEMVIFGQKRKKNRLAKVTFKD